MRAQRGFIGDTKTEGNSAALVPSSKQDSANLNYLNKNLGRFSKFPGLWVLKLKIFRIIGAKGVID